MCSLLRLLLGLSLSLLASTACRKTSTTGSSTTATPDTLIPGLLIRSPGSWTATTPQGSTTLDITVHSSTVDWSVTSEVKMGNFGSSSGTSSSGISLSSPADPWFVFVESSYRLWFFDGKDELTYSWRSPNGNGQGGTSIYDGRLHPGTPPVPHDLVPHLPPELQKLFPAFNPANKRPSL